MLGLLGAALLAACGDDGGGGAGGGGAAPGATTSTGGTGTPTGVTTTTGATGAATTSTATAGSSTSTGSGGGGSGAGGAGGEGGGGTGTPELVFASDWSTAEGNTEEAITDGGAWDRTFCGVSISSVLAVVPGESVGWTRTERAFRIQQRTGGDCGGIEKGNALPASTSFWGRLYFRNDETAGINFHPVTLNLLGDIQSVPWARAGFTDGVRINANLGAEYPHGSWYAGSQAPPGTRLPNGTWFRYEFHYEFLSELEYRFYPRVYDMAGELLYDETSYFIGDSPYTTTLASWYAESDGNVFRHTDAELARSFGLGQEGQTLNPDNLEYWYFADVALSLEGWIGP
jgi:hypothetical protein